MYLLLLVLLATLLQQTQTHDYFDILGYQPPESGMANDTTVESLFMEKIRPLFENRKLRSDKNLLREYVLLLEAQRCISDIACIDRLRAGEAPETAPSNSIWTGIETLSPGQFSTKVLDQNDTDWLLLFVRADSMSMYHVELIRASLLDVQLILKPDVTIGVVECAAGRYDLCTVMGNMPALTLWDRDIMFTGEISLYNIARFLTTHLLDVEIHNFKVEDIIPFVASSKRSLFLIDSTAEELEYPDLKTILALTAPYVQVGIIDCVKYYVVCNKYPLPERTPLRGFTVEYYEAMSDVEDVVTANYGLVERNGGSKPTHLIKAILSTAREVDSWALDAGTLHKMIIKARHGRRPQFGVFMGPPGPSLRLHALKKALAPMEVYHLDCSELELYCYKYSADEDNAVHLMFKQGGFEYLMGRNSVHDRVLEFKSAADSKLFSMRPDDLYELLQEGTINNTIVQYYNSSTFYTGMMDDQLTQMRLGASLVHAVYKTVMYLVDCAFHGDICTANKVKASSEIHYISTNRIIREPIWRAMSEEYLQFVKHSNVKDVMVEEQGDKHNKQILEEFNRFDEEL